MAAIGNACSRMSFTKPAKLPHSLMMAICSSRQSGWLGMMPRSRQMSAMTAPIGWRRTTGSSPVACFAATTGSSLVASLSRVGRCMRRASASSVEGAAAGRGVRGARRVRTLIEIASLRSQ
jgi:hypothetical protein